MNIEFSSIFVSYSNCLFWPSHNSYLVRIWSRIENRHIEETKKKHIHMKMGMRLSFCKHALDMTVNASFKLGAQNPVPSHCAR